MELLFYVINMASMTICFYCCAVVLREKASENQKYLMMTFLCGFLITVGNMMEFRANSVDSAITAVKMAYIGKSFIMLYALQFGMSFCRFKAQKGIIVAMSILSLINVTIITRCDVSTIFYSNIDYKILDNGRLVLLLEKGPLYYVWMVEFAIEVLWYIAMTVYEAHRRTIKTREERIRTGLLVFAILFPLGLTCTNIFSNIFVNFDPTSMVVVLAEIVMLIDVKQYGLLDTMQLAQERILEETKDGIIVIDNRHERVLFVNAMAKELLPELKDNRKKDMLQRIFATENSVLERDGRHYEIRVSEITSAVGKHEIQGVMAWIFDMTFINNYTNEMIKLKEASEQANLAKTNFLAHMSHEIRTPMNAIVGYAELALRTQENYLISGYLKNIKESAKTLLYLINEILDISKIETGKMEVTNVTYQFQKLVREVQDMMESQAAKKGLLVTVRLDEDIPDYLIGDRVKLQEIITNLVSNSLKYTQQGSIALRISLREQTDRHVKLRLEVADTGIGIEKKNYAAVFEKFEKFDSKRNYDVEGTGLGLSIVKSFVEMMDGTITFESEYEKGTTFIVDLWQGIGRSDESEMEETQETEVAIKHGRILIVDDNELNCDVAQGILECLGMEATYVMSGKECLELLMAGESYDMIFMDHMMPEMDGVETLHRIRLLGAAFEKVPIVLLTANAVSGVREEMLHIGFDDFLSKPIDIDELKHILIRFLGSE